MESTDQRCLWWSCPSSHVQSTKELQIGRRLNVCQVTVLWSVQVKFFQEELVDISMLSLSDRL